MLHTHTLTHIVCGWTLVDPDASVLLSGATSVWCPGVINQFCQPRSARPTCYFAYCSHLPWWKGAHVHMDTSLKQTELHPAGQPFEQRRSCWWTEAVLRGGHYYQCQDSQRDVMAASPTVCTASRWALVPSCCSPYTSCKDRRWWLMHCWDLCLTCIVVIQTLHI